MFETIEETLHTFDDGLDLADVLAVLQQIQAESNGKYISIDVRTNEYTDYDYVVHQIQVIGTRLATKEEEEQNRKSYAEYLCGDIESSVRNLIDTDAEVAKNILEKLYSDYFKH